tara:strand:- start:4813 stop:7233 length:2421 start_codon:yes stop_codon:yes gene_type:complete
MAKFKNIIGTGFPKYVTDQLEARKKLVSKTTRDSKDLLWLSNRTGWFRMTSGALIEDKSGKLTDDLAKNNILQGGLASRRGGFDSSYINGPLGKKPMPGITSLSVGTGGRWQTLLQGEVEFIAYDLNQLGILSNLYMSLGVHVFIEWGHKPYIKNNVVNTSTDINPVNFFQDFPQSSDGAIALQRKVNSKKEQLEGNYEALIGRVYNFDYNANPDGSYTCKIKVMGAGAMADSLRGLSIKTGGDTDSSDSESPDKNISDLGNALMSIKKSLLDLVIPRARKKGGQDGELKSLESFTSKGPKYFGADKSYGETLNSIYSKCNYKGPIFNETVKHQNDFQRLGNAHQFISNANEDGLSSLNNDFYTGYVSSLTYENHSWYKFKNPDKTTYITLGHLFCLVQHLGIFADTEGTPTPAVFLDYHPDNTLVRTGVLEASIDPSICLIPFSTLRVGIDSGDGNEKNTPTKNFLYPLETKKATRYNFQKGGIYNKNRYFPDNDNVSSSILKNFSGGVPFGSGKLFNVLVSIDFAYNALVSLQESNENKEVALREYLQKILNGINIALGKNNNFKIVSDECGLVLRVIDENHISTGTEDIEYMTIPPFGTESIAYDYSYSSKISKNLASQIVIASQAQSDDIEDFPEDVLSYFKLNGGVSDRFTGKIKPPVVKPTTPTTATESELRSLQNLYDQLYNNYSIPFGTKTANKGISQSLVNLYASLQQEFKNKKCISVGSKNSFQAGVLIPLEMSITIDGMSGILPYNAFLLPNNRLPERYKDRVAFIVFSINHTFDNNQWKTTLRGQTIIRPDKPT